MVLGHDTTLGDGFEGVRHATEWKTEWSKRVEAREDQHSEENEAFGHQRQSRRIRWRTP